MNKIKEENAAIEKAVEQKSSTTGGPVWFRRLHYWWSLFAAGALLAVLGPPALFLAWLTGNHDLVYPLVWRYTWLKLGVKVGYGRRAPDPKQTYVFVSNHRSYLDTVTLFIYGRRVGLLAKGTPGGPHSVAMGL